MTTQPQTNPQNDFIRDIIAEDLKNGKNQGRVITRFPPEPNGYLHIGHAKSICLNFGAAMEFNGRCHLRFDDTNPIAEDVEYVESIKRDVAWLGFAWGEHLYFASDYYDRIHDCAVQLIRLGKAYVCELSGEEFKTHRGEPSTPGRESPWRDRPVAENLDLFARMRAGEFDEGKCVLRAKIDMASPNLHMRDPVIYRIKKASHHRTGDRWNIYPMYDFAHCLSDSFEGITHSICTLEFEVHRPLYDWFLDALGVYHPRQIEFARLNLSYTVMSKRKLQQLVERKLVSGWDDPRMPTIAGLRRRGYTPEAIRRFCATIGVTKYESLTDVALLEHCLRDDLNKRAQRVMAVLRPLPVTIVNMPDGGVEELDAVNNPEDPSMGSRKIRFSNRIYIEQDDFMENPPKEFFRLAPGRAVRLRYAGFLTCLEAVKNADGGVRELRCELHKEQPAGQKVKATIHWVCADCAKPLEARLYDRLFTVEDPADESDGKTFIEKLNPASLAIARGYIEPSAAGAAPGTIFQFERLGYFCADLDSAPERPVFNRASTLRDTWEKIKKGNPR